MLCIAHEFDFIDSKRGGDRGGFNQDTLKDVVKLAYHNFKRVGFIGRHYRKDIAHGLLDYPLALWLADGSWRAFGANTLTAFETIQ